MSERSDNPTRLSPVAERLWKAGVALALFLATCVVTNFFAPAAKQLTLHNAGYDFLAFYSAGTFVREGRTGDLYKIEPVRQFEQQAARRNQIELGNGFGPYWNPPVFAWVFVPLSRMPYRQAWWVWFAINVACAFAAVLILILIVAGVSNPWTVPPNPEDHTGYKPVPRSSDWRLWGLVPLLVMTSLPFIMALGHGQNTCVSLLLLAGVVWFWRRRQGLAAGLICGLLCYKPQLAVVVAAMLILTMGWRALLGLGITGSILLGISALTLPGATSDWLARLPALVTYMQVDHPYLWERHVTLKAFWRLLVQGYAAGNSHWPANVLWIVTAGAVCVGLLFVLSRYLGFRVQGSENTQHTALSTQHFSPLNPEPRTLNPRLDLLIAATIVSMPLLMPFYFDYDLLLLAVAAVLIARERLGRAARDRTDRAMFRIWVALFIWMFVNPSVTRWTHVNVTTILLSGLAACAIIGACSRRIDKWEASEPATMVAAE